MRKIEVIPAMDIIENKCVRLRQGDYKEMDVYSDDPVQMALRFKRAGYQRLHLVDLEGAKSAHVINLPALQGIVEATGMTVDFGGGVKTDEDIEKAFSAGASMVNIGSIAVKEPQLFLRWLKRYGSEKIILGADVKDGKVRSHGWLDDSGETLIPFLEKYIKEGVSQVLCTDISKDGMMKGPAVELYKEILSHYPDLRLIASGGVRNEADIERLDEGGVPAVVVGKAFYEGGMPL